MIASSVVAHHRYTPKELEGQPFTTIGPAPKIRPIASLGGKEYEAFMRWTLETSNIVDLQGKAASETQRGATGAAGHYRTSDEKFNVTPSWQR
jgi:hypothetical protein